MDILGGGSAPTFEGSQIIGGAAGKATTRKAEVGAGRRRRGGRRGRNWNKPGMAAQGMVFTLPGTTNVRTKCAAQTLKPVINDLSGATSEQWVPCAGHASNGDVLCPIHRRLTNTAAAVAGVRVGGSSFVRVPYTAFGHVSCKFPVRFAKTLKDDSIAIDPDTLPAAADKRYEIWNSEQLQGGAAWQYAHA